MKLIYLAPLPWSSFAQRPHFMARYLLRNAFSEVIWVEPYPSRLPVLSDLRRSRSLHDQGTKLEIGLTVIKTRFLPVDPLPGGYWLNSHLVHPQISVHLRTLLNTKEYVLGIGKPSGLAVDLLESFQGSASFYDAMDDFPQFHHGLSQASMRRNEERIVELVDNVVCSSTALINKFNRFSDKLTLIKNAFDDSLIPQYTQKIRSDSPVIGYIGSLGKWFDWDVVCSLAELGKEYHFQLIGPQLEPAPVHLPANVSILPPCRHDEVPRHLAGFDVGLIPFLKNKLTDSVDPVKYYEYRATGLPVITTRFGQMRCRSSAAGVFFCEDDHPRQLLDKALSYSADLNALGAWRDSNSWSKRFEVLDSMLRQ